MEHVKKIIVSIQFHKDEVEIGELISEGKAIYFKYYTNFLKLGLEISPIKLKLSNDLHQANNIPFDGLFGVFADALPDGWGMLLLDRTLLSRGISIHDITPLDRLAFVGSNGMGALNFKPEFENEQHLQFNIELDEIFKATTKIMEGTSSDILDNLYQLGGSSGGARPKIVVAYNSKTNHLINAEKVLPKNYEHWLIKFPSLFDSKDIANTEYAYYKMALDAGIEMSESKLFKSKTGKFYFGTKRFDREGNNRLHLHSAAGIMHDNFRLSTLDYGHLMDCAFLLEKNVMVYQKILRLAAFNVFAHNKDDHSKNFSFLMDGKGTWRLAPVYDLTFSNSSHGMHSTSIANESANPTKKDLMKLAQYFKIKNASDIIDEVQEVVFNWKHFADEAKVSKESKTKIAKVIGKR